MLDTMRDRNLLSDSDFRAEFRAWLEAEYPAEWRCPIVLRLQGEDEKKLLRLFHKGGWRLPAWPREHGGLGLSLAKQLIFHDELEHFGAARFLDSGGELLGPILIKYGSPEQKDRYLPEILQGDVIWCQGYSEPNAGSDLASLKTTAVLDGDAYVVNGSKIWTTMVTHAERMFLLARTSSEARKQQGMSFFLMDLDTPGVTVRPIQNLAGDVEFGQVFLDNVRIPAANLVGGLGNGWTVAKALLGVERLHTGSPALSRHAFAIFERAVGAIGGDDHQDLHARLLCEVNDLTALYEQICDAVLGGMAEDRDFSTLKIASSELFQRIADAVMQVTAEYGGTLGPARIGDIEVDIRRIFMIARAASIYGGANEVQRDIIARALLGRPG